MFLACLLCTVVAATVIAPESLGILPAHQRRRRRPASEKGLPPDSDLLRLAAAYLNAQRKLWPALAQSGLLPEPSAEVLAEMAEDFKLRHRHGKSCVKLATANLPALAGCYCRYSCDNSSPNSTIDQMANCLRRAREAKEFIPWQFVFADYSVSGLDSSRQGYTSYKSVLESTRFAIRTTYIDDFTRASRQEREWWSLAFRSRKLGKGMIGASDGFDLKIGDWEARIGLCSIVSRMFIASLREKVRRGMKGGHGRNTCLGKPPFGFTRKIKTDAAGRPMCHSDGKPIHELCWDPDNIEHAKRIFEMFCIEKWSLSRIAKKLNSDRVANWDGWTSGGVRKILWNPAFIGVFVWNRFRREYDPDTDRYERVLNPRKEWVVRFEKDLAVIPLDLYRAARRRLAEIRRNDPRTGKTRSRNQFAATTLFSGTLFCRDCENEIKLIRSTAKYKQMGCINGADGKHKCTLKSSKSTRTIECCLLKHLTEFVFADSTVDHLVGIANSYIDQERVKPRTDVTAKQAEARSLKRKVERLVAELELEDKQEVRTVLRASIGERQQQLDAVNVELAAIARREIKPPAKLNRDRVVKYLSEIREVLNQATPAAADTIRAITGPIIIHQEKVPGRKTGAKWIATFSPRFLQFLAKFAKDRNYPDSHTLEYLSTRIWITNETVTVGIQEVRKADEIAEKVAELVTDGHSDDTIAMMLRASPQVVQEARTGRKRIRASRVTKPNGTSKPRVTFHDLVIPLKKLFSTTPGMTLAEAARRLGCGEATIRRAYGAAFPEVLERALVEGAPPQRSNRSRLSKQEIERIKELLRQGARMCDIEAEIGCSRATVSRIKSQM